MIVRKKHHLLAIPIVLVCLLLVIFLFIEQRGNDSQYSYPNPFPEENQEELDEWLRMRLADPRTGQVPVQLQVREYEFVKSIPSLETNFSIQSQRAGAQNTNNNHSISFVGPYELGGRTRAVAIDITNEDVLFAGGVSGGLWRTEDAGTTWNRVSDLDASPSISSIVQDKRPGKEHIWYYGTGETKGSSSFRSPGVGVFKSQDGGTSWKHLESTLTANEDPLFTFSDFSYVNKLAIDCSNTSEDEIYAAVGSKIIRSVDGFKTYDVVLGEENGEGAREWSDIVVLSNGTVVAAISGLGAGVSQLEGVFISSDGLEWKDVSPSGLKSTTIRIKIAINPTSEDEIYFLNPASLHKYTISTEEWESLTSALPEGYDTQGGGYNMALAVSPENENAVFLGGVSMYRSTNGFQDQSGTEEHWPYHSDLHDFLFFPSNASKMLLASDGGVGITENALGDVSWNTLNDGYHTGQFYSVALHPFNAQDTQVLGGTQDNGTWYRQESEWRKIMGGDGAHCAIMNNYILVSWQKGNLLRGETNNGDITLNDIKPEGTFMFINPFTVDQVNNERVAVGALGEFFLTNNVREINIPEDWQRVDIPHFGQSFVSSLEFSVSPENTLFLGSNIGRIVKIRDVNRPDNQEEIVIPQLTRGSNISSISLDPRTSSKLLVSASNYNVLSLFHSSDGGSTWENISGNLEESEEGNGSGPSVFWVEILPNGESESIYLAGTSSGLYMTTVLSGNSTTWSKIGDDVIGNAPVDMMATRFVDGTVAIGTHGNAIFQAKFNTPLMAQISYSPPQDLSDPVILQGNKSSGSDYNFQYQWLRNGEIIDGATGSTYAVESHGDYSLRLTNTINSEISTSNAIRIDQRIITSFNDDMDTNNIKAFPNPSSGIFHIVLGEKYLKGFALKITDIGGKEVYTLNQKQNTKEQLEIDLSNMPDGVFTLTISNGLERDFYSLIKSTQ